MKSVQKNKIPFLIFLGILLFSTCGAFAQSNSKIVYVNTNSVNIREKPDTKSKSYNSLKKYYALEVANVNCPSDWTPVKYTYYDSKKNKDVTVVGYVSSRYVTSLEGSPIQIDQINNKPLKLATDPKSDEEGSLSFSFNGNNFEANYRIVIKSWVEEGGSGTADWAQISGTWVSPGYLKVNAANRAYDMTNPQDKIVIYDKEKGLLYFGGQLWIVNK